MIVGFIIIVIGHHYIYHIQFTKLEGSKSLLSLNIKKILIHILSDYNSKRLLFYLLINLAFMFVELFVGIFTNSLGLISDAGHMTFDSTYNII